MVRRSSARLVAACRKCAYAAVLATVAGCSGPDRGGVVGVITRSDGTPLVGARVTARSDETGKWATGITDESGRYELGTATTGDGIPPGDYYVKINEDRGSWDNPRPRTIPAKYEDPQQSGLRVTVAEDRDSILDVKLDPP